MKRELSRSSRCCTCLMSRRCFLATSAAAFAAPLVGAAAKPEPDGTGLGEYIDLASFRPKPEVCVASAVVRPTPPYWLGWPGTSYDVEGWRRRYARDFADAARRVGAAITEEPAPLESDDAVNTFIARVAAEKPDTMLVHLQHLGVWHWVDAIAKCGVPTIIFSPIGTSFTPNIVELSRRPRVHVVSALDPASIEQAIRMIRAKKQFAQTRLLVVAGEERKETVLEGLGTKVRYVPRSMLHELFARMPENEEVREVARTVRKHARDIVEPTRQDCLNAARSYITAKRLMRDEAANAITTDCLGMVSTRVVPTPPCMAASLFQDSGVTYGCEADVFGALSLMFSSYVFDKPGYMNDPVADTERNLLIAAHCVCGTKINGFGKEPAPYILRSHSESNLGVSMQVLWEEGQPATLVRFTGPNELILDTGTVVENVQTPPAGGCRTSVALAMDRVEDARDVMGFHQVVFSGNHRRDVEAFCQMWGIRVVNSPERAPREAIS